MLKKTNIVLFISISFLLSNSINSLLAQTIDEDVKEIKAEITGTFINEEEVPLAGVSITLTSKKTGMTSTTTTSEDGKFRFVGLIPYERYELKADLSGFAKVTIDEIFITTSGNIGGMSQIDITGGIRIIDLKSGIITEDPIQPVPKIYEITINENSGLDPINHEEASKDKSAFYYSNKKIFTKHGIAEIGVVEKKLSTITEIPYKDEDYTRNELNPEEKFVYAIRIGDNENWRILLIRIIKINEEGIIFEYLVGD